MSAEAGGTRINLGARRPGAAAGRAGEPALSADAHAQANANDAGSVVADVKHGETIKKPAPWQSADPTEPWDPKANKCSSGILRPRTFANGMIRPTLFALCIILAGCTGSPSSSPGDTGEPDSVASRWWQATTSLEGRGAVRLQLLLTQETTCTILMAAHHPLKAGPESHVWMEVRLDGEYVDGRGGHSMGMGDYGIETGPVSTMSVTRQAEDQANDALNQAFIGGDEFTSWRGYPDWPVGPGVLDVFVQMEAGLQPGEGVTEGASALVRVGCAAPILARAQDDAEPTVITSRNMDGGTNVVLWPAIIMHQGSTTLTTVGPTTEIEFFTRDSQGSLQVSGAFEDEITWTRGPTDIGRSDQVRHETQGPSGNLTLEWDMLSPLLGFAGGSVWSWEPIEPMAVEPSKWPWE